MDQPTTAQIDFVEAICRELDISEPEEFTKQSYSEFIDEYKDSFYNKRNYS